MPALRAKASAKDRGVVTLLDPFRNAQAFFTLEGKRVGSPTFVVWAEIERRCHRFLPFVRMKLGALNARLTSCEGLRSAHTSRSGLPKTAILSTLRADRTGIQKGGGDAQRIPLAGCCCSGAGIHCRSDDDVLPPVPVALRGFAGLLMHLTNGAHETARGDLEIYLRLAHRRSEVIVIAIRRASGSRPRPASCDLFGCR